MKYIIITLLVLVILGFSCLWYSDNIIPEQVCQRACGERYTGEDHQPSNNDPRWGHICENDRKAFFNGYDYFCEADGKLIVNGKQVIDLYDDTEPEHDESCIQGCNQTVETELVWNTSCYIAKLPGVEGNLEMIDGEYECVYEGEVYRGKERFGWYIENTSCLVDSITDGYWKLIDGEWECIPEWEFWVANPELGLDLFSSSDTDGHLYFWSDPYLINGTTHKENCLYSVWFCNDSEADICLYECYPDTYPKKELYRISPGDLEESA